MEPEGRDDPPDQGGILMKDKPTVSGDYLVKKERLVYMSTHENPGELRTSWAAYIFLTRDGTNRVKVVEHGGWPTWVDESVIVERVPPSGLHAFTPATSPGNKKFIAVAMRR
uniref:Uncharacterized protein n=1 Tax=Populus trichocarpa TaxID=3694 RepID=B9HY79_POPTR